jgi:hypothetical protein
MTDTATQDTRSAHNVENQGQETTPTVATDPPGGNTKWHHDIPTWNIKLLERRDDDNDHGKGRTTRTDENAYHYYFTERLPHMNLTRVGMRAGDFPYEDFTNGKDGRRRERMRVHTTTILLKVSHTTCI